jgi:hypothetical protein
MATLRSLLRPRPARITAWFPLPRAQQEAEWGYVHSLRGASGWSVYRGGQMRASAIATLLFLEVTGCSHPPFITVNTQPTNVGDTKSAALRYHDSGAYDRDLAIVAAEARRWIQTRAGSVGRPALVLDIDETALSNWPIIKRDDFGRPIGGPCVLQSDAPCGWAAWDQLGNDEAISPTLEVFRQARALNVEVFFITGRPESQRQATERNLLLAGYAGYRTLYMVPDGSHFESATDFKAPIREQLQQNGYQIIANIGDQPSDLLGGQAEKMFLLPDPFYRVP